MDNRSRWPTGTNHGPGGLPAPYVSQLSDRWRCEHGTTGTHTHAMAASGSVLLFGLCSHSLALFGIGVAFSNKHTQADLQLGSVTFASQHTPVVHSRSWDRQRVWLLASCTHCVSKPHVARHHGWGERLRLHESCSVCSRLSGRCPFYCSSSRSQAVEQPHSKPDMNIGTHATPHPSRYAFHVSAQCQHCPISRSDCTSLPGD